MGLRIYLATLVVALVVIGGLDAAVAPVHNVLVKPGQEAQKCVCMNGKWCEGEVINDVECHPSYIMVCCIQPEPEPNPPYPLYPLNRFETDVKEPQVEKETPQPSTPVVSLEKLPEVIKETSTQEKVPKEENSSEGSSESSEEIDDIKVKEKERINVIQV